MLYKITHHAWKHLQQKGKNKGGVKMLMCYGQKAQHNACTLRGRDAKRQIERRRQWLARLQKRQPHNRAMHKRISKRISALEVMRNCTAILADDHIITIYNNTRRHRTHGKRPLIAPKWKEKRENYDYFTNKSGHFYLALTPPPCPFTR